MEPIQKNKLTRAVIASSLIVMSILIFGTIWIGKSVSEDTEKAVRNVSLLYLDELAGRREQVVASTLENYISDMDIALELIERDDLSSLENLQAYQARMKQLYGLERFAFVDTEGLIYTSRGTRNDIAKYNFDYNEIAAPEISIKNLEGDNKKLIVAIPLDNFKCQDKTFVVCFMEIDMKRMLGNISLQSTGNNSTFCNLYTSDGISLTNFVLGGLASESNLFHAMQNANFKDVHSPENVRADFATGRKGVVSFSYDNIRETMYYVPVRGTNWMLTYLIRESVIGEQISSITDGIIFRNLVQIILTAIVLIIIFSLMINQMQKASRITFEKEKAEAENLVRQQELEEQLALQEELLSQEQVKNQQENMITALASDYRSVYYVNLAEDEGICYRKDASTKNTVKVGEKFPFKESFTRYANLFITEPFRADFLQFIDVENIRQKLENVNVINYRYIISYHDKESYEMIKIVGIKNSGDKINTVGIGLADIDAEMKDSIEKSQALSDALQTAENASRAKTAFLSSMSHEIRTPMNAIIGLDSLALNEKGISETTKNYLEKIGESAKHLLSLINDILDMSRIESGKMIIKNEEFAFSKLVEQINTIFSGQCQEKKLHYTCNITGEIDDYYIGDAVKIRQVLINILGNAVKFTPEGGQIDFIIEKTASFNGKSTIQFVIQDTGIGMSKEYLPKIFETFSQEDSTNTNKYGSTGLGMAITKNIVEMMNGTISVESEKGVGTKFTVIVTLTDSDKKISAGDEEIELRLQDMTILVIDDDPIACDHAKLVLDSAGVVSEIAHSGAEAIEMVKLRHARMTPYNLIIVDWQMPEMDGLEVTRQIRSIIGEETAVIILTAYNWEDIVDEAIKAGVDSFISKPLFSSNLITEFKAALKKKSQKLTAPQKKVELEGRKILLAEDMPVNAEIMMMVLEMRGMEGELAENGEIAVEMFQKSPINYYSAILMDVRMPKMDGLQATQEIRKLQRPDAKKIPIIALTANAFDEDVQRSLQAGLNAHLSKPVEPETLFKTLENMIHD
ncbi:MAG: response regulator [Selenomonadaceae bacterium]|nr:response regulator [Selenomonadaceae bacterium]